MSIVGRDDEPFFSSQKSFFKQVAFHKGEDSMDASFGNRGGFFPPMLGCEQVGIGLHLGEKIPDRMVGSVNHEMGEGNEGELRAEDLLVDGIVTEAGRRAVVETDDGIGIPASAIPYPFAVKIVAPINLINCPSVGFERQNGVSKFWRHHLITVNGEDPVVGCKP